MRKILAAIFVLLSMSVAGQEVNRGEGAGTGTIRHHSIGLLLGHTHITEALSDGEKKWITLPSFGLDYNYRFNERWSLGLHNELVLEDFIVITSTAGAEEEETIERTNPFTSIVVLGFKPGKHFTFQAGLGEEFEKEENLTVGRVGIEYSWELPAEWEFLLNGVYDLKFDAYDSWVLSVGMAKVF